MDRNQSIFKGYVVEILDEFKVVALLSSGEIQTVQTDRPYQIGDEIVYKEKIVTISKTANWKRVFGFTNRVAMVSLILIFISFLLNTSFLNRNEMGSDQVYASTLYVESKSNIEVKLNRNNEVMNVRPLNDSAKRVLTNVDWKAQQVDKFVNLYFKEMKSQGYLGAEDKAIISVIPIDSNRSDVVKEIKQVVNQDEFIKENGIEVLTVSTTKKVVEQANRIGITVGKFLINLTQKAMGQDTPFDVSNMMTVTDLINVSPLVTKILPNFTEQDLESMVDQELNKPIEQQTSNQPEQNNATLIKTEEVAEVIEEKKVLTPATSTIEESSSSTVETETNTQPTSSNEAQTSSTNESQTGQTEKPSTSNKDNSAQDGAPATSSPTEPDQTDDDSNQPADNSEQTPNQEEEQPPSDNNSEAPVEEDQISEEDNASGKDETNNEGNEEEINVPTELLPPIKEEPVDSLPNEQTNNKQSEQDELKRKEILDNVKDSIENLIKN